MITIETGYYNLSNCTFLLYGTYKIHRFLHDHVIQSRVEGMSLTKPAGFVFLSFVPKLSISWVNFLKE